MYFGCDTLEDGSQWVNTLHSLIPKIAEPAFEQMERQLAVAHEEFGALAHEREELESENARLKEMVESMKKREREREKELRTVSLNSQQKVSSSENEMQTLRSELKQIQNKNLELQKALTEQMRLGGDINETEASLKEIQTILTKTLYTIDDGKQFSEKSMKEMTERETSLHALVLHLDSRVRKMMNAMETLNVKIHEVGKSADNSRQVAELESVIKTQIQPFLQKLVSKSDDQNGSQSIEQTLKPTLDKMTLKLAKHVTDATTKSQTEVSEKMESFIKGVDALIKDMTAKMDSTTDQNMANEKTLNESIHTVQDRLNAIMDALKLTLGASNDAVQTIESSIVKQISSMLGKLDQLDSKTMDKQTTMTLMSELKSVMGKMQTDLEESTKSQLNDSMKATFKPIEEAINNKLGTTGMSMEKILTKLNAIECLFEGKLTLADFKLKFSSFQDEYRSGHELSMKTLNDLHQDVQGNNTGIANIKELQVESTEQIRTKLDSILEAIETVAASASASEPASAQATQAFTTQLQELSTYIQSLEKTQSSQFSTILERLDTPALRALMSSTPSSSSEEQPITEADTTDLFTGRFTRDVRMNLSDILDRLSRGQIQETKDWDLSHALLQQIYDAINHMSRNINEERRSPSPVGIKRIVNEAFETAVKGFEETMNVDKIQQVVTGALDKQQQDILTKLETVMNNMGDHQVVVEKLDRVNEDNASFYKTLETSLESIKAGLSSANGASVDEVKGIKDLCVAIQASLAQPNAVTQETSTKLDQVKESISKSHEEVMQLLAKQSDKNSSSETMGQIQKGLEELSLAISVKDLIHQKDELTRDINSLQNQKTALESDITKIDAQKSEKLQIDTSLRQEYETFLNQVKSLEMTLLDKVSGLKTQVGELQSTKRGLLFELEGIKKDIAEQQQFMLMEEEMISRPPSTRPRRVPSRPLSPQNEIVSSNTALGGMLEMKSPSGSPSKKPISRVPSPVKRYSRRSEMEEDAKENITA